MGKTVRLQISLPTEYAAALGALAEKVGWSQSGLAADILSVSVSEEKRFHDWLSKKVAHFLFGKAKKKRTAGESVCIQVMVPEELAADIEAIAEGHARRPADMAGVLMRYGIEESERITELFHSRVMKAVVPVVEKWVGPILKREKQVNGKAEKRSP